MLFIISALKLVTEIALLAMLGQWLLGLLAGAQKERNVFYQILQMTSRPFVLLARRLTPAVILDCHLPFAAFCLVLAAWLGLTLVKIDWCLKIGVMLCR